KFCWYAQVVGGDGQALAVPQLVYHRQSRSAAVEHGHRIVLDELGGHPCDVLLLCGMQLHAQIELPVSHRGGGLAHRPAMGADQQSVLIELIQVAADGVDGDAVVAGQFTHGDLTALSDELGNAATPMSGQCARSISVRYMWRGHAPFLACAADKCRELHSGAPRLPGRVPPSSCQ